MEKAVITHPSSLSWGGGLSVGPSKSLLKAPHFPPLYPGTQLHQFAKVALKALPTVPRTGTRAAVL